MKNYVLYDPSTGAIVQKGSTTAELPSAPGLSVLELTPAQSAQVQPDSYVVSNGKPVAMNANQQLPLLKRRRWELIKNERDRRAGNAGTTSIGAFDTTPLARANITSMVVMLLASPTTQTVNFTLADNTRKTFTRNEFISAALTVGSSVQQIYDTADQLRLQIDAATTPAQVAQINWPTAPAAAPSPGKS